MIVHKKLVECTAFTNSSVVTHILLSLSRGGTYVYDTIMFHATRDIITIEKQSRTIVYQYTDKEPAHIVATIVDVAGVVHEPARGVFRESMVRDYVSRQVADGTLDAAAARRLVSRILFAQIVKLISSRDIEIQDGRIVGIHMPARELSVAATSRPAEPPRLDAAWIAAAKP